MQSELIEEYKESTTKFNKKLSELKQLLDFYCLKLKVLKALQKLQI